jgi:hypothetical protein
MEIRIISLLLGVVVAVELRIRKVPSLRVWRPLSFEVAMRLVIPHGWPSLATMRIHVQGDAHMLRDGEVGQHMII